MDEVKEPRWRAIVLGGFPGPSHACYRRISAMLLLTVSCGLLAIPALTISSTELLQQMQGAGLRRFLPLARWFDVSQLSRTALLLILLLHLLWYLVHRLIPRVFHVTAHVALLVLLTSIITTFSLGMLAPAILTAFNLLVIMLYPTVSWPLILVISLALIPLKMLHHALFGLPYPASNVIDHVLVIGLLIAATYELRSFGARYRKYIKEAQGQLEQFRSIRNLLGNGLVLINADLSIQSKANHQARYLLGAPLEKGSSFPEIIVELAEQGNYLKEQIESFFRMLQEKNFTDSERANINPMHQLRIFYPGGYRYLCIDAQRVNSTANSPFVVSVVDVSSHVELQKRREQWLTEEFQQAELMRSFLMDDHTLAATAVELRRHYLTLDRIIFEDRYQTNAQQRNPHEFARLVGQELLWLNSTMAHYHFRHLASRTIQCQQLVQEYEDNSSYYNLLNLYTSMQLLILELRRLRKVMLNVFHLHQRDHGFTSLSVEEGKRLVVLMQYLWSELENTVEKNR